MRFDLRRERKVRGGAVLRSALALALLAVAGLAVQAASPSPGVRAKVLEVSAFMRNVEQHRGSVQVRGVVSEVSAAQRIFTMIDVAEYLECQSTGCAPLYLPVRWTGSMPGTASTVRVRGRAQSVGDRLIFVADAVSVESSGRRP